MWSISWSQSQAKRHNATHEAICDQKVMTALLQRAIAETSKLSDEQQDAIASLILEELEDEAKWDAKFSNS